MERIQFDSCYYCGGDHASKDCPDKRANDHFDRKSLDYINELSVDRSFAQ